MAVDNTRLPPRLADVLSTDSHNWTKFRMFTLHSALLTIAIMCPQNATKFFRLNLIYVITRLYRCLIVITKYCFIDVFFLHCRSLLVYVRYTHAFYHYDSCNYSNSKVASVLCDRLIPLVKGLYLNSCKFFAFQNKIVSIYQTNL